MVCAYLDEMAGQKMQILVSSDGDALMGGQEVQTPKDVRNTRSLSKSCVQFVARLLAWMILPGVAPGISQGLSPWDFPGV